jgi:hypothetical protein
MVGEMSDISCQTSDISRETEKRNSGNETQGYLTLFKTFIVLAKSSSFLLPLSICE